MKDEVKRALSCVLGLFIFSFGEYLGIQANIGLAPWMCLNRGLENYLPISFGTIHTVVSLLIVGIDLLMHEKIGFGTILDAVLVGPFVDLFTAVVKIPLLNNWWLGIALMTVGLFIKAYGMYFYMKAGLSCGPRDSLLVGLGRLVPKVPIGVVNIALLAVVTLAGWLLGGNVGLGTIYSVVCIGLTMQIVFNLLKFEPRDVQHDGFADTIRKIGSRK